MTKGCWYCGCTDGEMLFSGEFDCFVHEDCLRNAAKNPEDRKVQIMFNELLKEGSSMEKSLERIAIALERQAEASEKAMKIADKCMRIATISIEMSLNALGLDDSDDDGEFSPLFENLKAIKKELEEV